MNSVTAQMVSNIISCIGNKLLGHEIDEMIKSAITFDMSCIYLFRLNHPAILVHNGYNESVPLKTLEAYTKGGYLLDPFYVACENNHAAGVWKMRELAPDSFYSSGFHISKDIHPCVSSDYGVDIDEVGCLIPVNSNTYMIYSIMKYENNGGFSSWDIIHLNNIFPILSSTLSLHCKLAYPDEFSLKDKETFQTEDGFFNLLKEQLTDTQIFISKLILQGHSNISISKNMNITEGTVKVHKHNIYQRLNISNNSDLLRLFIDYLTK